MDNEYRLVKYAKFNFDDGYYQIIAELEFTVKVYSSITQKITEINKTAFLAELYRVKAKQI